MADEEEPGALPAVRHVNIPIIVPSSSASVLSSSLSSAKVGLSRATAAATAAAPQTPIRKEEEKKQDSSSSAIVFDESPFDEAGSIKKEVQLKELDDIVAKINIDDEPLMKFSRLQYQPPPSERNTSSFQDELMTAVVTENKNVRDNNYNNYNEGGTVRDMKAQVVAASDTMAHTPNDLDRSSNVATPLSHTHIRKLQRTVSVPDHPGDEVEDEVNSIIMAESPIRQEVIDPGMPTPTTGNSKNHTATKVFWPVSTATTTTTTNTTRTATQNAMEYDTPDDETADNAAVPTFAETPDDEKAISSGTLPWRQKMVNMTPESAHQYQQQLNHHHQGLGYNSIANHSKDDPSELTWNDSEFGIPPSEDDDVASKMMDDANLCLTQAVTMATDILVDGFATVGALIEDDNPATAAEQEALPTPVAPIIAAAPPPTITTIAEATSTTAIPGTMTPKEGKDKDVDDEERGDREQPEMVETDPEDSDPEEADDMKGTDNEGRDVEENDIEGTVMKETEFEGSDNEETEVEETEAEYEETDTEDDRVVTVIPALDTSDDDNDNDGENSSQEQVAENWANQVPSLLGEPQEEATEEQAVDRELIFADQLETPKAPTLLLAKSNQFPSGETTKEEDIVVEATSVLPSAVEEKAPASPQKVSSSTVTMTSMIVGAMAIAPAVANSVESPSEAQAADDEKDIVIQNVEEEQMEAADKEEPVQEKNATSNDESQDVAETSTPLEMTIQDDDSNDNEWDPINEDEGSVSESDGERHYITDAILKGAAFHARVLGLDSSGRSSFLDMPMDERMVGPEGVDPWIDPPAPRSVTPVPGYVHNNSTDELAGSRNFVVNPSIMVRSESFSSTDTEKTGSKKQDMNRTYTTEVNMSHDDCPPDEERPPVFENPKEYPEVTTAVNEKKNSSPKQNRTGLILIAIILVLLLGVILIGVAFGTNAFKGPASGIGEVPAEAPAEVPSVPTTNIPSASPITPSPTMQRNDALGALLRGISLAPSLLDDSSSTEAMSMRFLQNVDPLQLDPYDTSPRNQAIIRQRYALANLFFAAGPEPNAWTDQSNWLDENECEWFGVSCIGRVVTSIEMPENSIAGTLSPELGLLADLRTLVLSNNDLEGTIPSSWSSLNRIQTLQLSNNRLSGTIPPSIYMSQLVDFAVEDNMLTGTLATEMGLMTAATRFVVSINAMSGSIPTQVGAMTELEQVFLNGNSFQGTIPPQLGSLSNLEVFRVADNALTGVIPEQFGNIPSLIEFNLDNNQLSGTIPSSLGNLVNLQVLRVGDNQYDGQVFPEYVYGLPNLVDLWLENCALSGTLSSGVGQWQNVSLLRVNDNLLSGTVPTELGLLSNVVQIRLEQNTFSGTVPTQLGAISSLVDLRFHVNELTGSVPSELGNLLALQRLSFGSNFISGAIPDELTQLTRMVIFSCEDNFLEGSIPASVGNWQFLQTFECHINRFDSVNQTGLVGGIPSAFGYMRRLRVLSLYQNGFTGTIPSELGNATSLQLLDLELNNLSGAVPESLGQLTQLESLRVGGNPDLTGPLPLTFCDLPNLTGFRASCGLTCLCCTERCGAREEAAAS